MPRQPRFQRKDFVPAALTGILFSCAALANAGVPAWVEDACAGLDCAAVYAGVGRADFLPEMRLSSAVAYAQAVRGLSSTMTDRLTVDDRLYEERRGDSSDSAIKAVVASPLGIAMTKIYGDDASDFISMTIELKPQEDSGAPAYAQEYVDVSSRTLYVRLVMSRTSAPVANLSDGVPWKGGRIRVSSQDIRAGRKNELTLWAEDRDAGLTWIEHWPTGGAELLRDGQLSSSYVFDQWRDRWMPSETARRR